MAGYCATLQSDAYRVKPVLPQKEEDGCQTCASHWATLECGAYKQNPVFPQQKEWGCWRYARCHGVAEIVGQETMPLSSQGTQLANNVCNTFAYNRELVKSLRVAVKESYILFQNLCYVSGNRFRSTTSNGTVFIKQWIVGQKKTMGRWPVRCVSKTLVCTCWSNH